MCYFKKKTCCSLLLNKNNLFCKKKEKITCRKEKYQPPPPLNIKWSVPKTDRFGLTLNTFDMLKLSEKTQL